MRKMKPGLALPPTHTHTHTHTLAKKALFEKALIMLMGSGGGGGGGVILVRFHFGDKQSQIVRGLQPSTYRRGCSWGSSASLCWVRLSCSLGQAVLRVEVGTKRQRQIPQMY